MSFTTEAKVGVVVILGAVVLSYMTFKVGGFTFGDKGYRVSVIFPTVLGLEARAPVRISGVSVGKVDTIALEKKGGAIVTLLINRGIEIPKDSSANIASSGLLGDRFVEILPGQSKASLADGERLLSSVNKGASVEQLTGQVADLITRFVKVADDVGAVTASLRGAFGTKEGEQSMKDIVEQVRSLTKGIDDFVRSNQKSMGNSISNLEKFSAFLNKEGQELLKSLTKITQKIESGQGTVGKLIYDPSVYNKLSGSLDDLDGSLKSVQSLTQKVEKGEGTIGKLFSDEKTYNNINTALEGVSNTLGRIQRFQTNVGFRNEYQLNSSQNKGYFSLTLAPRQDKYYLVELVDDPLGKVALTTHLTTKDGVPSTETDLETTRKLKFSAEFGKRLPDFGLRIGLMENAFGIGGDLYSQDDHLKVSVDAWDFNSDDPLSKKPHLKVSAQYELLRYIHVGVGYDQILNSRRDTLFIGAGLRFDDEDIKYLIGGLALSR